ncbi:MAG: GNAT family N-acetyltransferase [Nitrososphaerales archaeon]
MAYQYRTDVHVGLRPMHEGDLAVIEGWLRLPHVAKWWLAHSTVHADLDAMRDRVCGEADAATHMLVVVEDSRSIGWAQWYCWNDYPAEAAAIGAELGEVGIDYAIGDPAAIGRGLGTEMIAALVHHVHHRHPGAGLLVGPDAENLPSRAVLDHNGFQLVAVRPVVTEATDAPIAIYRLLPPVIRLTSATDARVVGRMLNEFNREHGKPTPE